ncbi:MULTISPECIES: hypothetical protein [unclassified Campylobacter]|uniref:hypothetical protein n=1 Tax=unclassified Campylobacter TaxID=2593542 RepID=UPI00123812C0|nr:MULTISPECIES: hypothetical protein [unclassified Campylobacter]KAA6226447.1 hypothetical protein FMM54_04210 [Campylobacter sp. LR185c]KAA6228583.1 hypothetical protein FMM55_00770 [Campylobacter sp. LR196d]KAA6229136.1 hypothetical protein FMM57_01055 [Campylobacter sp. LR286c]KAA6233927.1 hypothetical protein FMM58_01185 [Campylobacter sp. LR291e]KAA6234166.1 hypothetical protein FMM56_01110 [Campylobacter sp. LR264d]
MVLKGINEKYIWNNKDLISLFDLYLGPADDKPYGKFHANKKFVLDRNISESLFYTTENPCEWLELCKRYDIAMSDNGTKTLKYIVENIAKTQNLDKNIF